MDNCPVCNGTGKLDDHLKEYTADKLLEMYRNCKRLKIPIKQLLFKLQKLGISKRTFYRTIKQWH